MEYKAQTYHNRFESLGGVYIDGFTVTLTPPINSFGYEETFSFEVTSAAVLLIIEFEGTEYILLTQQADREGLPWELPSGKVDLSLDPSPEDTAKRELKEETGFSVSRLSPLTYAVKPSSTKDINRKGALQYHARVKVDILNIQSRDEDRIYLEIPANVNREEIAQICLERRGSLNSLLSTTGHRWAYRNTFKAYRQKPEA